MAGFGLIVRAPVGWEPIDRSVEIAELPAGSPLRLARVFRFECKVFTLVAIVGFGFQ